MLHLDHSCENSIENLDIVLLMSNLEWSDEYSMTSANVWNYYRDERNDSAIKSNDDGIRWITTKQ